MCAQHALAVSRLLAMLHLRYGRLRSHLTLRALYICSLLFVLIVGVARLPMLNPVNREAVPLVHTLYVLCVVYFSLHTLLYLSRKSRQKRFSYSATREAAKWSRVKIVLGHASCPVIGDLLLVSGALFSFGADLV